MFQQILSYIFLGAGILFGIALLRLIHRDREILRSEQGSFPLIAFFETIIFIIASLGISDYLQNTLLFKYAKLGDDKVLPGTLVACGLVPGAIFGFSLLKSGDAIDPMMMIACGGCVLIGSFVGSRMVGKFDSAKIRKIMQVALIASFVLVIVKTVVSAGAVGTATSLPMSKLILAATLCFATGAINMFGIPMKPTWTAMFLILGLSPIVTLTLVLVVAGLCPLSGGINVIRRGVYHRKQVLCAVTFGSLGALIGTSLAVSIPANILNVVLLGVMLIAIITMFKK